MNILDYIDWRGDLSFDISPFNPPDSLILSMLCMIDMEGIVPQNGKVSLRKAAREYFVKYGSEDANLGLVISPQTIPLLKKTASSKRFGGLELTLYQSEMKNKEACQFSAITMMRNNTAYVCFRGTDDTLTGWKEDFAMSFRSPIPAQTKGVEYLRLLDAAISPEEIITCGHSKGGNLAVYSATFCPEEIRGKITEVYSHDGPGFPEEIVQSVEYRQVIPKIRSFVPQNSIIGMILQREDNFTVVKSTQKGIFQHDGFSWQIMRDHFIRMKNRTAESEIVGEAFNSFIKEMSKDEREEFTEALFALLGAANAQTLLELAQGRRELLSAMKTIAPETKETVNIAIKKLLMQSRRTAQEYRAKKG